MYKKYDFYAQTAFMVFFVAGIIGGGLGVFVRAFEPLVVIAIFAGFATLPFGVWQIMSSIFFAIHGFNVKYRSAHLLLSVFSLLFLYFFHSDNIFLIIGVPAILGIGYYALVWIEHYYPENIEFSVGLLK